jgi:hypothetical protein
MTELLRVVYEIQTDKIVPLAVFLFHIKIIDFIRTLDKIENESMLLGKWGINQINDYADYDELL